MTTIKRWLKTPSVAAFLITAAVTLAQVGYGIKSIKKENPTPLNTVAHVPQGPPQMVGPPLPQARLIPTSDDAVRWASEDLDTRVHPRDHCYTRYLFDPLASFVSMKTSTLTLNLLSRASAPMHPIVVADGYLLRYDLRWYAPRPKDQAEWLRLLESFRFDPQFNRLLTKSTLALIGKTEKNLPPIVVKDISYKVIVEPGPDYRKPIVRKVPVITDRYASPFEVNDVFVENSPDINPEILASLRYKTQSLAPVVDHRYFKFRAFSSIQERKAYKDIWAGLWYELTGTETADQRFGANFQGRWS
jgi:hypothetical protein